MLQKQVYGYIRVSTTKQGKGVSLQEQKNSILQYAQRHHLEITHWFEEKCSAAKQGRHEFNKMMVLLKKHKAYGVVIHKIDRSARNIRDWASINELSDAGIEVHFSHEGLGLNTRGNRLVADVQAVISADYIRNLREEREKGFNGRLKQGLYPLAAPLGYLNTGKGGQVKVVDSTKKDLVIQAFRLYATCNYSLISLTKVLNKKGLTNSKGNPIDKNGLNRILRNPFYMGLIKIYSTGDLYQGIHEPLITSSLFQKVQDTLDRKTYRNKIKHQHLYSKIINCQNCNRRLTAEIQKSRTYYRCHTKGCKSSIREDIFESYLQQFFCSIVLPPKSIKAIKSKLNSLSEIQNKKLKQRQNQLNLELSKTALRLNNLINLLVDGVIDQQTYQEQKHKLLNQKLELQEKIKNQEGNLDLQSFVEKFELSQSLIQHYFSADRDEKRYILLNLFLNLYMQDGRLVFKPNFPYSLFTQDEFIPSSGHLQDTPRTLYYVNSVEQSIVQYIENNLV